MDYTVKEAAEQLGVSDSLVRRLCRRHDIGREVNDRLRLLTAADIERIRAARKPRGNPNFVAGHTPPPRKTKKSLRRKSKASKRLQPGSKKSA